MNDNFLLEDINSYDNYKIEIVTKIAYLLGIRKSFFIGEAAKFIEDDYYELEENINAKIIRELTTVRGFLFLKFTEITSRRNNLEPMDSMVDILPIESINFLNANGIEVIKANIDVATHIAYINQYILEKIDLISNLFPDWIKWEYIKNIFLMPGCYAGFNGENASGKDNVKELNVNIYRVRKLIYEQRAFYPYGAYINWPLDKMKGHYGNILYNDEKFLKILYASHDEVFRASEYVIDATDDDKNDIYNFIEHAINVAVLVDCENVDPYRFLSVFKSLDEENYNKIKKIILYDDPNTSIAWHYIASEINLPFEHITIERIIEGKSLVDISMSAGASREYYKENTESLILASSDSDFFGLIQAIPTARFFILNETEKTSDITINRLNERNIKHCYMDSFAQDTIQDFKSTVLFRMLKSYINYFNETGYLKFLNPYDLVEKIFKDAYLTGNYSQLEAEKKAFYNKYLKKGLKIIVKDDVDGPKFKMELIY